MGLTSQSLQLIMDRACEDNKTHQSTLGLRFIPVVPPPRMRIAPPQYDREMCRHRDEVQVRVALRGLQFEMAIVAL